jgi:hypothetical protein
MELVVAAIQHLYLLKSFEVFKAHETFALAAGVAPSSLCYPPDLVLGEARALGFLGLVAVLLAHLDGLLEHPLFLVLRRVALHGVEQNLHHELLLALVRLTLLLVEQML